uniref:CRISPR-associated endonuclease Cas3'' n=1 Tax=Peptostreptococcus russellii TaxID=215200 RepID=UPI0026F1E08F
MKVEKYFVDIKNIIVNNDDYYAHRIDGNSQVEKEKLIEHIERCEKYFIRIFEEKEISDVVEKFEKIFFKTPEENKYYDKEVEFFRLALFNIITFHDIGKINPLFQSEKMKNPKFAKEKKPDETLKSYHSELSSIIYIDYFESLLDSYELEKEIKKLMRIFILMFSFIISRHHSYLSNLDNYIRKFYDKDPKIEAEKKLLEELLENKIYVKNIEGSKFNDKIKVRYVNSFVRGYKKQLKEFNASIEIYTLSRLMYSMLVASDYYATTEYMNELEIRDLGNIKYFDEIYGSYKNGDIYKAINNYRNNRVDVKEVGKEGINILRSELFIDAEDELNKNKEKNIFYLEAPTGSGKSNTAMNLSFKLIENDKKLNKIFYIYPFNTLVEQNLESINKIFEGKENVMSQVAVVNSLFKLKNDKNYDGDSNEKLYESKRDIVTLLDRQFL